MAVTLSPASIVLSRNALTVAQPTATVTFTFAEPVLNFDRLDVVATGGTVGVPVTTDGGRTWTATLTATTQSQENRVTVNLAGLIDGNGQPGQGTVSSEQTFSVDTRPALATTGHSIADPGGIGLDRTQTTVTIKFSEAVTGFDKSDVQLDNGGGMVPVGVGGVTAVNPDAQGFSDTWNVTIKAPLTGGSSGDSKGLSVNLGGVTDKTGNTGTGGNANQWTRVPGITYNTDLARPVARITLSDTNLALNETAQVTITFVEAVTGFSIDDLDLTNANGTLSNITETVPGTTWTATLTPTATLTAVTDCSIVLRPDSGVQDLAGNTLITINPATTYTYDPIAPDLTSITVSDRDLGCGETATVIFTFSERVTGFNNGRVTVPNGTLSTLITTDGGRTWTGTLTPTDNLAAVNTNTISVNLGGVKDIAGNLARTTAAANTTIDNYRVDTHRPALVGITATENGNGNSPVSIGETATVTFTFTEAVQNFAVAVQLTGGSMGALASADGGVTWSATFTPGQDLEASSSANIILNLTQVRNLAGNFGLANPNASHSIPVDTRVPSITSATVTGTTLVLVYSENLDNVTPLTGTGGFSVTNAAGQSIDVDSAVVDSRDRTRITLTLGRGVAHGETVTISYIKPSAGSVVQDVAGNDAANVTNRAVTNDTPDTTAPTIQSATVDGNSLVLTYNEDLDTNPAQASLATEFAVTVGGQSVAIDSTITVEGRTVTLTLVTALTHEAGPVRVSYEAPVIDNTPNNKAIQDTAGNDAADLTNQVVTNKTQDNMPPVLITTGITAPEVNMATLALAYNENLQAADLSDTGGFTVTSAAGRAPISVTKVVVSSTDRTVTLTLSRAVTNDETVTVSYTGDVVKDTAGNSAADITNQAVINETPDTTAPVLNSAAVNGTSLVLTYNEWNNLQAADLSGTGGFTVTGATGMQPIVVTRVVVSSTAKTVTLTLGRAVANAETVTISYTGNVVKDTTGNSAANITNRAVTNNTPDTTAPVLNSATVTDSTLVLTYTEANSLDAAGVAVGAFAVRVNGVANTVTAVAVDAAAKTVTLTLTNAVPAGATVSVAYTKPESGNVIQDAAGNKADSFAARTVNSGTDSTAPTVRSATVTDSTLVLSYDEANSLDAASAPATGAFAVLVNGVANAVTAVTVNAADKTVKLTLTNAVPAGATVSVAYTKPESGNVIQDAAGNDAASFEARTVTSGTDTTAPTVRSATVTDSTLVLSYDEANSLDAASAPATGAFAVLVNGVANTVTAVAVDAAAKTVKLTLTNAVPAGATVSVAYTKPTSGNVIQDAAGNDAASFAARTVTSGTDTTAPTVRSATVTDSTLVLSYDEANSLDAASAPATGAFAVLVNGVANAVTAVTVDATAKTVKLTLTNAVPAGATVSVAYTKPTSGNVIQDAAGNDAASFAARTVSSGADTTDPTVRSATVTDSTLVLSYDEANSLDANSAPATGAFAVLVNGVANTVTAVAVDAAAKTVTLTLTNAVPAGATVSVAYTKPESGNVIQDAAGNKADSFEARTVNSGTDTTAPTVRSATVTDSTLVLSYDEANSLDANSAPAAGAFAVRVNGVANTVTAVAVDATAKTVKLTLTNAVPAGATVSVAYTKPTSGNVIQDAAGNDAASFAARTVSSGADTTAPTVRSATVTDSTLVLSYDEANSLDANSAPATGAFAVLVNGVANTVTAVVVDAAARTVKLTLTNAVPAGATVSMAYTKPESGNVIQDAAGNKADSFAAKTVSSGADTTAPTVRSATVTDSTLVLSYDEANSLDAASAPPTGAFAVRVNGVANTVTAVAVDAAAKTVKLTLTNAVPAGATVSVAYTKPTSGNVIQDAAGNKADSFATRTVSSGTDTTAPTVRSATVTDSTLVLSYDEANSLDANSAPATGAFAVLVNGVANAVTAVTVDATAKTVKLTLTNAVPAGATVSVAYTKPTSGNVIQDAAGNKADSFTTMAVTSGADTTAPTVRSATVTDSTLVLSYDEANSLDAASVPAAGAFAVLVNGVADTVTAVTVDATAKTVKLTLTNAVPAGATVSVAYTKPESGNVIQDAAGNKADSFAAKTVSSGADTTDPTVRSATVTDSTLVLSYDEANSLDANSAPATGAFAVLVNGVANTVTAVAVDAAAKTVTLTLTNAVPAGATVSVAYTKPTSGNVIQDAAGNDAASFAARTVTSGTDTTAPTVRSATVTDSTLVLIYDEANSLDANSAPATGAFAVLVNGVANTVTAVAVDAAARTVKLTLTNAVPAGATVSVAYTKPESGNVIQDAAGNKADSFAARTVSSGADTTAPTVRSATVTDSTLVLSYDEANSLDAASMPVAGAFAVRVNGVANTVTAVAVDAAAKTVTLTLTNAVPAGATVSVAYTKPTSGNVIQDAAGNKADSFVARTVTSGADTTAPTVRSATVTDSTLVLSYDEANSLDAASAPATGAFAVLVNGVANTVTAVTVDAAAKTVKLTLTNAVPAGATVSVAYTKPTSGNVIQDAAGNDAASFAARTVTSGADTTAPTVRSATVTDSTLVLSYDEANSLDAASMPVAGAFAVLVNGVANTVTAVSVDATAKTVKLTLTNAVPAGATVSVAYTKPTSGNVIQDAAGNKADSFEARTVSSGADTTAPTVRSATVTDSTLVLSYDEANSLDAAGAAVGAFAVLVNGVANTVTAVAVDAAARTVTLTLTNAVPAGATVSVAYTKPTSGNVIQDAAGNKADSFAARTVSSGTDSTAPTVRSATVTDSTLVLSYDEANSLDANSAPATGAFAVLVNGVANAVTAVTVNAADKTVKLTLTNAVPAGATVSVAYTKPESGNVIQDAAGNDAASFEARTVSSGTDSTAPTVRSATVTDSTLVLSYDEANSLDAASVPVAGAFAVLVNGVANTVTAVSVDATAKTVKLTLTNAVPAGATVSVAYTKPESGNVIQDAAGNDAASFAARTVTSGTDTTAPTVRSATVTDSTLVLSYDEANSLDANNAPATGAFAVLVNGVANTVTAVAVDAAAKTVKLTLTNAVPAGATVSVAYTKPTSGNVIQDAAGNKADSFAARTVTSGADSTAPTVRSATVTDSTLVLSYDEANSLDVASVPVAGAFAVLVNGVANTVTAVAVDATAKTVKLTLTNAVPAGATVSVAYTKPESGNVIQDAAGNKADSFAARTVSSGTDTTAPTVRSATVTDSTLVLSYDEANSLDAAGAAVGAFAVLVNGVANTVTAVAVDAAARTVTLTLTNAVPAGATVSVAYTKPTSGNVIQDAAGNKADSFAARTVSSGIDSTAPTVRSATVSDSTLVLSYDEANSLNANSAPAAGAFAVLVNGVANTVTAVTVNATAKTATLTLTNAVPVGAVVTVAYTRPESGNVIRDAAGNSAASFAAMTVGSGADTTAPTVQSAAVSGSSLVLTYTETNNLDAASAAATGAFKVLVNGVANAVTGVTVNAAAKTVTLTLTNPVPAGAVVTVAYTRPTTGNVIQDAAGNSAASFAAMSVSSGVDTTAPVINDATASGNQLVLTYDEANNLDATNTALAERFAVLVNRVTNTVTAVTVNAAAKTVTLTLTNAVTGGETVSVAYTKPTTGNDIAAIQDATGNDAASFTARQVASGPDTTVPVISSVVIRGNQLVLTCTEANNLDATNTVDPDAFTVLVNGVRNRVTVVTVDPTAKTVTLTLTDAVTGGETVTIAYTDPSTADDANALQDATGNDVASTVVPMAVPNGPDTTAPTIRTATVSGALLVLGYTEANRLDATNTAATGAFSVLIDSVATAVTAVAVDAVARTVTLTLATAVASGQKVTVAYTDPSAANDANAIQDAAGNDAASFAAMPVTNDTPAPPPPPAPPSPLPPPPPPKPRPKGSDWDNDGVPNAIEDQAHGVPGPQGAVPVVGDGNGDGIKDSEQSSVGSVHVVRSPKGENAPADEPTTSVTLVVDSEDGKVRSDSDAHIISLDQKNAPDNLPGGLEMPIGLVRFETVLATGHSKGRFSLFVDPALGVNGYWVRDGNGIMVNLASKPYDGNMEMEGDRLRLDFQIADGDQYDADGAVNGSITAPGAPAYMPLSIVGQVPDVVAHQGFWF